MSGIQAYICNNSFPTSIAELRRMAPRFDMEELLGVMMPNEVAHKDFGRTIWTAPTWCKNGDIVFFMHSKTAVSKITKLVTELKAQQEEMEEEEFWYLLNSLRRAKAIWNAIGGKIFAIGLVAGGPEYYSSEEDIIKHWRSNIYAPIKSIFVLEKQIDASELSPRIKVSMTGSITPVYGKDFDFLRKLVTNKNKTVRRYLLDAIPQPIPLAKMSDENWIEVSGQYRREFSTVLQFRKYYTDYLLRELCDQKKIYVDCLCNKEGNPSAYIDNIIRFHGKYLMIRVVMSVPHSTGLFSRLQRYTSVDEVDKSQKALNINAFWKDIVLVIDTIAVYLYTASQNAIYKLYDLDDLKAKDDVTFLRSAISDALNSIDSAGQKYDRITHEMLDVDPDDDSDYEDRLDEIWNSEDFDFDELFLDDETDRDEDLDDELFENL